MVRGLFRANERVRLHLLPDRGGGAVAGMHDGLGRQFVEHRADRVQQQLAVAERQVTAADR